VILCGVLLGSLAIAAEPPLELHAASIRISDGTLDAEGEVTLTWERHHVRAELMRIELIENGPVEVKGEDVWWTPCSCEQPPWAVSADSVEGVLGDHLVLRRARLRVCDVPVLPVPWMRIPMDPRAPRVLFPEGGIINGSPWVALPLFVPVGSSGDLKLAPELWRDRGVRQRTELSGRRGTFVGIVGQEEANGSARGMMDMDAAHDDGGLRVGVDAQWVSDDAYLNDFGANYFLRSTPWTEQRAVAGVGPARLESARTDTNSLQRPVSGVVAISGHNLGPLAVSAVTRIDAVDDPQQGERGHLQRGFAEFGAAMGRDFGIVEADSDIRARAVQWSDSRPWSETVLTSSVHLPLWGDVGSLRHLASIGAEFSTAYNDGLSGQRLPWEQPAPEWAAGPVLRSQWLSERGIPVRGEGRALMTPEGIQPTGDVHIQDGPWAVVLQGSPEVQGGRAGFDDGSFSLGVGAGRTEEVFQMGAHGSVQVGAGWHPGWSGLVDVPTSTLVRHGPELFYSSPCGCLDLRLQAEWAPDRAVPDALVRINLH
jgi:hypothetical protein